MIYMQMFWSSNFIENSRFIYDRMEFKRLIHHYDLSISLPGRHCLECCCYPSRYDALFMVQLSMWRQISSICLPCTLWPLHASAIQFILFLRANVLHESAARISAGIAIPGKRKINTFSIHSVNPLISSTITKFISIYSTGAFDGENEF